MPYTLEGVEGLDDLSERFMRYADAQSRRGPEGYKTLFRDERRMAKAAHPLVQWMVNNEAQLLPGMIDEPTLQRVTQAPSPSPPARGRATEAFALALNWGLRERPDSAYITQVIESHREQLSRDTIQQLKQHYGSE